MRSASFTPQKSELSSHQVPPGGVVPHLSSWTAAAYEPCEGLFPPLFGLRHCDRLLISTWVDFWWPARPTLAPLGSSAFSDLLATIRLLAAPPLSVSCLRNFQNRFACSDVSWRCRKLLKKRTPRQSVGRCRKRSTSFCIRLRLWMRRIHRFSILGTHISSAKRRAGACALFGFALGTQSSRARECSVSTSLVYVWDHQPFEERCSHATWQQIICNADRAVLQKLARDPGSYNTSLITLTNFDFKGKRVKRQTVKKLIRNVKNGRRLKQKGKN